MTFTAEESEAFGGRRSSADGCEWCRTLGPQAGACGVVVMVTVSMATIMRVTSHPLGKRGRCLGGEDWGQGG